MGHHAAGLEGRFVLEVVPLGSRWKVGIAVGQDLGALGCQVLDQSPQLVDVEELAAEADGQDWLSRFETVAEDLALGFLAVGVERGAFGVFGSVVACRVDVSGAAGKNKSI